MAQPNLTDGIDFNASQFQRDLAEYLLTRLGFHEARTVVHRSLDQPDVVLVVMKLYVLNVAARVSFSMSLPPPRIPEIARLVAIAFHSAWPESRNELLNNERIADLKVELL